MRAKIKAELVVTALAQVALLYLTYRIGCQQGVHVTEKVVHKYAPDTHKLITDILNKR